MQFILLWMHIQVMPLQAEPCPLAITSYSRYSSRNSRSIRIPWDDCNKKGWQALFILSVDTGTFTIACTGRLRRTDTSIAEGTEDFS